MDTNLQDSSVLEEFRSFRVSSFDDENAMEVEKEGEEDDVDEGYDEEDEDNIPAILGFVEKPENPERLLRHFFPNKAGGVPAWLDPVILPSQKSRTCGFCGSPIQFVLQVYDDTGNESTYHRTLYVFMCPSMGCLLKDQHEQWKRRADGSSPRSVKVFRCQLPLVNPFYSTDGEPIRDGAPLCCWCGTWKGDKVCGSCKLARYCCEKHQALHWHSGHRNDCQLIISSQTSDASSKVKLQPMNTVACKTLWPEYEIIEEDERLNDAEASKDNGSATSLVTKEHKVDETFQVLVDKFEGDTDKKCWVSFEDRISIAPEQVLRYRRDVKARPLWPVATGRPTKEDIPNCSYCAGPMCYEFQIMPQLLYYFNVENDADSLDWATIVVYTCSASCEATSGYREEFPWVQIYS